MQIQVKLSNLKPNPFRNMERYPIQEEKIQALILSYKKTGFWGNVVGRKSGPNVEIAYGHHRLVALRTQLKEKDSVDIIVKDLDDETMLRMMADENMQEWGSSAEVNYETVRAVVEAYAEGKITLGKVGVKVPKNKLRYAPKFTMGDVLPSRGEHPYDAETVGKFLGWDGKHKVGPILNGLALEEAELTTAETVKGLNQTQARIVTTEANKAQRPHSTRAKELEEEAEKVTAPARKKSLKDRATKQTEKAKAVAKTVAKNLSEQFREGGLSVKEAPEVAKKYCAPKEKTQAEANDFCRRLSLKIRKILKSDELSKGMKELIKWSEKLTEGNKKNMGSELKDLSERALVFNTKLFMAKSKKSEQKFLN